MSNGGDWCCVSDIDALNDVYREIAELIGYDDAMILYTYFKGQQITFPVKLFKPECVSEMIKKQYDGTNAKNWRGHTVIRKDGLGN